MPMMCMHVVETQSTGGGCRRNKFMTFTAAIEIGLIFFTYIICPPVLRHVEKFDLVYLRSSPGVTSGRPANGDATEIVSVFLPENHLYNICTAACAMYSCFLLMDACLLVCTIAWIVAPSKS
jgi:hypothetical protein